LKKIVEERLKVNFAGIEFNTPLLPASGTFGYGFELRDFEAVHYFGGLVSKGLSLNPREGNPPPRLREVYCGVINSIGLENPGIEAFLKENLPQMLKLEKPIIINLAGHDEDEFLKMVDLLNPIPQISAYEINISCPNVQKGGLEFYKDKDSLKQLLRSLAKFSKKVNIVKIPPDLFHYRELVELLLSEGFKYLTVANTYPALYVDIKERRFYFSRRFGGLSGPAIYPLTLGLVYSIKREFRDDVEIIGSGGVCNYEVAIQYLLCGAKLVEIGSANFVNPNVAGDIYFGILRYLDENHVSSVNEIIGLLLEE